MITLRIYSNAMEAGMAKSMLDEHNIFCSLADENANLYGGAPLAMPVRLLVSEEQADEARRILETTAQQFKNLESTTQPQEENSMSNELAGILDELKKLRSRIENNTAIVVLLLVGFVIYILVQLNSSPTPSRSRQSQTESWNSVLIALDNREYDKAAEIAQRLTEKNPNFYYGYAYLGYIALEKNRLKDAEGYFARAYELYPTNENEQKLEAVRKRLAVESPK